MDSIRRKRARVVRRAPNRQASVKSTNGKDYRISPVFHLGMTDNHRPCEHFGAGIWQ
jgi:hypothetical protein